MSEQDCMRCEETFHGSGEEYCPKCRKNMNRTDMATKPTHTPGPWTIVEVGPDEHLSVIHDCCESAGCEAEGGITEIADIYYQGGDGSMEAANARLIAAAPAAERDRLKAINAELLGALEELECRFSQYFTGGSEDGAISIARAAIAKAKGE